MPRISIIIPCYNVDKYLEKCLDSLIGQTLQDIEIIPVDDGSPDTSGEICDRYAAKDSRIKPIHKANGGVSAARNDGLSAATGEYVFFCDGDDWMPKDACELLWNEAERSGADVVFGDILRSWEDREEYMRLFAKPFRTEEAQLIRELIRTTFYYTYCPMVPLEDPADGCYGGPWNKIVRRSLLTEHNISFDLRVKGIYDDVLYSAYVLAEAKTVAYIGKPVYNYRQVATSMTRVFKKNILQINEMIFTCWQEFLQRYDPQGEWRAAYYGNVMRRLDHAVQVYFLTEANPAPKQAKRRELARLIRTEPYRSAACGVERSKLDRRHRVLSCMAAAGSATGILAAYSFNRWRKRNK